jgi:DNA-binding NtrC family response regulator
VRCADTRPVLQRILDEADHDLLFVDRHLLGLRGHGRDECRHVMGSLRAAAGHGAVVVCGPHEDLRLLAELVRAGADTSLTYPVHPDGLHAVLEDLQTSRRLASELDYFRSHVAGVDGGRFVRLRSEAMREVYRKVKSVADTKTPVLLLGETGTGKGVVARLIHALSNRAGGPFISVHCGSIPDNLFESEIFGHEKGAFTGADRQHIGKLELGCHGTVLLDEIGTMSPALQVKLLQVLQERIFQRVGGDHDIPLDARIISATNADLAALAAAGSFRKDLFFRLNVFPICVPPLRERTEDIPTLAEHFLDTLNALHGRAIKEIHPAVIEAFLHYEWPGNLRELENLMERAYLLEATSTLTPFGFPPEILHGGAAPTCVPVDTTRPLHEVKEQALAVLERAYLARLMTRYHGRIDRTAAHAGLSTRHLRTLLARHGLDKREFKTPRS